MTRAVAGFCPFGAADAAAIQPHPLLVGLGDEVRAGEDHIPFLRAVYCLAHACEGMPQSITTDTSVHYNLLSCLIISILVLEEADKDSRKTVLPELSQLYPACR